MLQSCVMKSGFCVQYLLNKFVYSQNGKFLFLFDTLENAKKFVEKQGGYKYNRIYECECEGVSIETPNFLKKTNLPLPKGTVWAYGVKLIREIGQKQTTVYHLDEKDNIIFECEHDECGEYKFFDNKRLSQILHDNSGVVVTMNGEKPIVYKFDSWTVNRNGNYSFFTLNKELIRNISQCIKSGYKFNKGE